MEYRSHAFVMDWNIVPYHAIDHIGNPVCLVLIFQRARIYTVNDLDPFRFRKIVMATDVLGIHHDQTLSLLTYQANHEQSDEEA